MAWFKDSFATTIISTNDRGQLIQPIRGRNHDTDTLLIPIANFRWHHLVVTTPSSFIARHSSLAGVLMSRQPHATDFTVDVDRIGRFTFARRSVGDQFKIRGRYHQLTDGFYDDNGNLADLGALAFVTIQTLLVSASDGFDLASLDPLIDDGFEDKILAIWKALRDKELSFRPKPNPNSQTAGPIPGEHLPAMVSR